MGRTVKRKRGFVLRCSHIFPRPRGRPRSFDEKAALDKATQVFWAKGYDGVTIDDLVAGMGGGRPSLYSIFGDKRTIFALRAQSLRREEKALWLPRHSPHRARFATRWAPF